MNPVSRAFYDELVKLGYHAPVANASGFNKSGIANVRKAKPTSSSSRPVMTAGLKRKLIAGEKRTKIGSKAVLGNDKPELLGQAVPMNKSAAKKGGRKKTQLAPKLAMRPPKPAFSVLRSKDLGVKAATPLSKEVEKKLQNMRFRI